MNQASNSQQQRALGSIRLYYKLFVKKSPVLGNGQGNICPAMFNYYWQIYVNQNRLPTHLQSLWSK